MRTSTMWGLGALALLGCGTPEETEELANSTTAVTTGGAGDAAAATAPASWPAGLRFVEDYAARGDGARDDSAAFAEAIKRERVLALRPGRTYVISRQLVVDHPLTVFSDGTATLLLKSAGNIAIASSFVTVRGINVRSAEGARAFTVMSRRANFMNIQLLGMTGDGLTSFVTDEGPRQAVGLEDFYYSFVVDGVTLTNPRGSQIDVGGMWATSALRNINIDGRTSRFDGPFVRVALNQGSMLSRIRVVGNPAGGVNDGIAIDDSVAVWMTGIDVSNVTGIGLRLSRSAGAYLRSLRFENALRGGLRVGGDYPGGKHPVLVHDVEVRGGADTGIAIDGVHGGVQMSRLNVDNAGTSAMAVTFSEGVMLYDATVTRNRGYAVYSGGNTGSNSVFGLTTNGAAHNADATLYLAPGAIPPIPTPSSPPAQLRADDPDRFAQLLAGGFRSIRETSRAAGFGGDATDALQAAVDSGKNVYLPPGYYPIRRRVVITKPVSIIGLGSVTLASTADFPFLIRASGVSIRGVRMENLSTDLAQPSGAIYIDARAAARKNILVSDVITNNYGTSVGDNFDYQAGIENVRVTDVTAFAARSTAFHFQNGKNVKMAWVYSAHASTTTPIVAPGFVFRDVTGGYLLEGSQMGCGQGCDITAGAFGPPSAASHTAPSLWIDDSRDVHIDSYMADTSRSHGVLVTDSANVNLSSTVSGFNALSQLSVHRTTGLYAVNTYLWGLKEYEGSELGLVLGAGNSSLFFTNLFGTSTNGLSFVAASAPGTYAFRNYFLYKAPGLSF